MNLGIDFGSTYTVLSTYRKDKKTVETLDASEASPYIPSEVSLKGDKFEVGRAAKVQNGRKGVRCFKGFKMLLSQENAEARRTRGYDETNTPEAITAIFLEKILRRVLADANEQRVESLVICAPEIWRKDIYTIDARTKLRDICGAYPFVGRTRIVSEPAAASAYFAYNYYLNTGSCFEGNILLIDYGGGTLDITVTNVSTTTSNKKVLMEILPLKGTGAGENQEGRIGSAGIVYMESVVAAAARKAGLDRPDKELFEDSRFLKMVNEFEDQLQSMTQTVTDAFNEFGDDLDDLDEDEDEFTVLGYKGEDIVITYSLMMEVYNRVIAPVLNDTLDEILHQMDEAGIDYHNPDTGNFKMALVGGFCNFCLVDRQISQKLGWGGIDRRKAGLTMERGDREKAVSLGAALLAEGIIDIHNTAPYSVGIFATRNGKDQFDYAFHKGQDIEFGTAYYPVREDGGIIPYLIPNVDRFILRFDGEAKKDIIAKVKLELRRRMNRELGEGELKLGSIGFSLDSYECLCMHFREYNIMTKQLEGPEKKIELTKLQDLIEPIAL